MYRSGPRLPKTRFSKGARNFSTQSQVVRVTRVGPAEKVLKVETETLGDLKSNQVLVKMLAAPISPTDLSLIEGYANPSIPVSVGGSEGVGKVVKVGSSVTDLKENDLVVPATPGLGTWRSHGIFDRKHLDQVPQFNSEYLSVLSHSMVGYRLLNDFVNLKRGDVLVQNAANSTVGISVIQLAKKAGIKTINIIRQRPNFAEVVELLKGLGGEMVVSTEYAASPQFRRLISDLPPAKLALNAVGGSSATELARILGNEGTLVTYGGMSRQPVTIPNSALIHKNIQLKGFSFQKWLQNSTSQQRSQNREQLISHLKAGEFQLRLEKWEFSKFDAALKRAKEPFRDRKVVLTF